MSQIAKFKYQKLESDVKLESCWQKGSMLRHIDNALNPVSDLEATVVACHAKSKNNLTDLKHNFKPTNHLGYDWALHAR